MKNLVPRAELEAMEQARNVLYELCRPKSCIYLQKQPNNFRCDGCKLSSLKLIEKGGMLEKEGYRVAVMVCPLEQSYSK